MCSIPIQNIYSFTSPSAGLCSVEEPSVFKNFAGSQKLFRFTKKIKVCKSIPGLQNFPSSNITGIPGYPDFWASCWGGQRWRVMLQASQGQWRNWEKEMLFATNPMEQTGGGMTIVDAGHLICAQTSEVTMTTTVTTTTNLDQPITNLDKNHWPFHCAKQRKKFKVQGRRLSNSPKTRQNQSIGWQGLAGFRRPQ